MLVILFAACYKFNNNNNNNNNNTIRFIPRSFYKNIQLRLTKDIQNNIQNK